MVIMGKELDSFSLDEVKRHNTSEDLWIILWNHVYNITDYQEDHPGGKAYLMENGGVDATTAYEDIGHSPDAREILDAQFLIGKLRAEDWISNSGDFKFPPIVPEAIHIGDKTKKDGHTNAHHHQFRSIVLGLGLSATALVLSKKFLPSVHTIHLTERFWYGFVAASIVSISLTSTAAYWASKRFSITTDFTNYPSHYKIDLSNVVTKKNLNLGVLSPTEYKKFPLTRKVQLSKDTYRFVFGLPHENDVVGLPTGQHVAIRAVIDGRTVTRSYTPSSSNKDLGRLEITIKIYEEGIMTQYLSKLKIGDELEIRGPKGVMKYHRNLIPHIKMIAGGTGITPMYSMIRRICEDEKDTTKITLLYGNKTEEDILLRSELEEFAKRRPDTLEIIHILSQPESVSSKIDQKSDSKEQGKKWRGLKGRIDKNILEQYVGHPPSPPTDVISASSSSEGWDRSRQGGPVKALICGPPAMEESVVNYLIELGYDRPKNVSHAGDQVFLFQ